MSLGSACLCCLFAAVVISWYTGRVLRFKAKHKLVRLTLAANLLGWLALAVWPLLWMLKLVPTLRAAGALLAANIALFVLLRLQFTLLRKHPRRNVVGFFHPSCDQRAGGERVLWGILQSILQDQTLQSRNVVYYIYTDSASKHVSYRILEMAGRVFNIDLTSRAALARIRFVFLARCDLLDPAKWPRFTMILQSLAALVPAFESLCFLTPDVMIDSAGYSFSYPLFKLLGGCTVMCYTHYPTISDDMISVVSNRTQIFNNDQRIARNPLLTAAKLAYYRAFAALYAQMVRALDLVMCNSTWTQNQLRIMWRPRAGLMHIVYPPCPIDDVAKLSVARAPAERDPIVVSVGQFRPEKNHGLQLDAFCKMLKEFKGTVKPKLILVGTERPADRERIAALRERIARENLGKSVLFGGEYSQKQLHALLGRSLVGLHTMRDEHFGIGVVELLAAGLITVAHRSAGPMMDIVVPAEGPGRTGYLAVNADEYAAAMLEIFQLYERERVAAGLPLSASLGDSDASTSAAPTKPGRSAKGGKAGAGGSDSKARSGAGSGSGGGAVVSLAAVQRNARAHCEMFAQDKFAAALLSCLLPALLPRINRRPHAKSASATSAAVVARPTIGDVPTEALLRTLAFLSVRERACVAPLVCGEWQLLAHAESLWQTVRPEELPVEAVKTLGWRRARMAHDLGPRRT